ncbi:hypothetical protein K0M31_008432 [Melipona bicolor]|uniref:Uncharacterized protein n=1 Tax=Melipona bicolor TaxID=60889 RepID=A0AA40FRT7_9HYME|nr:hypothetical protein K0M31_008432 [Melipona bicolor]
MLEKPKKSAYIFEKKSEYKGLRRKRHKVRHRYIETELLTFVLQSVFLSTENSSWSIRRRENDRGSFFRQFVRAFRGLDSGSIRSRGIDLINFHRRPTRRGLEGLSSRSMEKRNGGREGRVRRVQLDERSPISSPDEKSTEGNQNRGPVKTSRHREIPYDVDLRIPISSKRDKRVGPATREWSSLNTGRTSATEQWLRVARSSDGWLVAWIRASWDTVCQF